MFIQIKTEKNLKVEKSDRKNAIQSITKELMKPLIEKRIEKFWIKINRCECWNSFYVVWKA